MKGASDGLERLERLEGRHACLASDDVERGHEEGNERRGIPFTSSPGNAFSCVTRVAWRIFHPDRGSVIAIAPGDGFWSKYRKWAVRQMINVLRVTRVPSGWKIPQTHGARVTDKTFRSCRRVKIAF